MKEGESFFKPTARAEESAPVVASSEWKSYAVPELIETIDTTNLPVEQVSALNKIITEVGDESADLSSFAETASKKIDAYARRFPSLAQRLNEDEEKARTGRPVQIVLEPEEADLYTVCETLKEQASKLS